MSLKKLAYLKVNVKSHCEEFCEIYTFLKPTTLYLPNNIILCIEDISKDKICLKITSNNFCKQVILSLCDPCKKITIPACCCDEIIICLNLCEINILKPCCKPCNNECKCMCHDNDYC